jgi:ribonuclease HI
VRNLVEGLHSSAPISIYVDGSCIENRDVGPNTSAGWGFVVIIGDRGLGRGTGDLIYEESGKVITDKNDIQWIGAEVGSNNTAELSAMIHALKWIITECPETSITVRADSMYALRITDGTWKAKENKILAATANEIWNEAKKIVDLDSAHVRAHTGHRWNERADHLAFRAQSNDIAIPLQFWKPGVR